MSRSYRNNEIIGLTGAESEKWEKRRYNRKYRRVVKERVLSGEEPPDLREVSDVWDFGKDGKVFFGNTDSSRRTKWLRK